MKIFNGILNFILKRKILSLAIVIGVAVGGYFIIKAFHPAQAETRYVVGAVEKGTIITTVTGSGQISATNQVDFKTKVSGEILAIYATKGQEIKEGDKIVQLDASDAYKALRDAQTNLETARLSMAKLKEPPTNLELLQAQNALATAKANLEKLKQSQPIDYDKAVNDKQKAEDNIAKGYEDAFSNISDTFLDLPAIITGLEDVLYETDMSYDNESLISRGYDNNMSALSNSLFSSEQKMNFENLQTTTVSDYNTARVKYNANFENYKKITRYSGQEEVNEELIETIDTVRAMSQAAKSEKNYLDTWVDYRVYNDLPIFQTVTDYQSELSGYIGQIDGHLSSLLSTQTGLRDDQESLVDAQRNLDELGYNSPLDLESAELTVKEKEAVLEDLQDGPEALDVRSAELSIQQRQDDLADAQNNLANYTVRAPFDGMIADIDLQRGDTLSSGSAAATIITKQSVAEISLNEVDVAKIKLDQKATLTFDAISDLSISGKVADVDIIGTVSQGVVTYGIKILFDTQDERVKPGMSVSAAIITDVKQDVLMVSNAAVKNMGQFSYVEMPAENVAQNLLNNNSGVSVNSLKQQNITMGLANDTNTEIIEGLNEGDQIITRTISSGSSATAPSSQGSSLFNMGGSGDRTFRGQ